MLKYLGHFGIVISISDSDGAADTLLGEKKEQDKADEQGMLEISNIFFHSQQVTIDLIS